MAKPPKRARAPVKRTPIAVTPAKPVAKWEAAPGDFADRFIGAIASDFAQEGAGVIARLRDDDPAGYLKLVALLVGKLPDRPAPAAGRFDELSPEEKFARAVTLARRLGLDRLAKDDES